MGAERMVNMANNISRRDFLKGLAAGAVSVGPMTAIPAVSSAHVCSIIRKRFAQCLDNADIINNQTIALTFIHTIRPGDRLHQSMSMKLFIEIQARQAFYIKARQPHRADKDNAERIVFILELFIQLPAFHLLTMRFDIQSPFGKRLYFILILTDDNRHLGFFHPVQLAGKLLRFLGYPLCR